MSLFVENKIIDYANQNDGKLWSELKSGNKAAFIAIYNQYIGDLIRYGCQLVNDKTLVEDTVQDLFVSLWEKKNNQADVHNIKFYLLSSTRRMLLRKVKKERLFITAPTHTHRMFEIVPSALDEKIRKSEEKELLNKIRQVVESLTDRQREIIYLKFYQNLSYKQIAEMLNLDQKYTYNLAARAFSSFKEKFKALIISLLLFLSI